MRSKNWFPSIFIFLFFVKGFYHSYDLAISISGVLCSSLFVLALCLVLISLIQETHRFMSWKFIYQWFMPHFLNQWSEYTLWLVNCKFFDKSDVSSSLVALSVDDQPIWECWIWISHMQLLWYNSCIILFIPWSCLNILLLPRMYVVTWS